MFINSLRKEISLFVALAVFCTSVQPAYAAELLPRPGEMVHLSAKLEPALMVGVQVDPKKPFRFNFIMDHGIQPLSDEAKRAEYQKLIKYFLASLTIPNADMWVNLSPHESDRIIPDNFMQTEMGRDLLGQDYVLKQMTASLIYPQDGVGREFWKKVYREAYEKYGTTDIPVSTFNKVWIVPDKAVIYEKYATALAVESHLKVMLESDYLAASKSLEARGLKLEEGSKNQGLASSVQPSASSRAEAQEISKQIMREVIIPALEKEVNEGANFSQLRQIYSAMLMATWFKKTLKKSILGQAYADKSKVAGVEQDDPKAKEKIYQRYLEAYKVGVFNFIKEEADPLTNETLPRKYFSGGMKTFNEAMLTVAEPVQAKEFARGRQSRLEAIGVGLESPVVQKPPVNGRSSKGAQRGPSKSNVVTGKKRLAANEAMLVTRAVKEIETAYREVYGNPARAGRL